MYLLYKLLALSAIFGLVLSSTLNNGITFDSMESISEVTDDSAGKSRTVDLVLPGLELLPIALNLLPKVVGLKGKAIGIAIALIKWLAPKTIFMAIGAVATFFFCKLSNLCSVAYDPVMYDYVPPQVQSFVTPERLDDAQQYLMSALQQYANEA